ncbi:hypothetical protein ACQP2P_44465 [Dactylosporangium sp. CA-139114]|uniref:hypothetical protein n=1 Tax=Dactylosporangium sp. CA-139114 TaxID=3239931 RepID=UPI003D95C336
MHLFFNDPRDGYVTRHRRIVRPSLAALVVGGVGVAALGVVIGSAGYDAKGSGGPPRAEGGGFAVPAATGSARGVNASGPLGMSTVPAAPVPILDLGVTPSPAAPAPVQTQSGKKAAVRVERTTPRPKAPATTAAAPAAPPVVVVTEEPVVAEPEPADEPTEEPVDVGERQGRHRWHQWGDGHRWRPWWEQR